MNDRPIVVIRSMFNIFGELFESSKYLPHVYVFCHKKSDFVFKTLEDGHHEENKKNKTYFENAVNCLIYIHWVLITILP